MQQAELHKGIQLLNQMRKIASGQLAIRKISFLIPHYPRILNSGFFSSEKFSIATQRSGKLYSWVSPIRFYQVHQVDYPSLSIERRELIS